MKAFVIACIALVLCISVSLISQLWISSTVSLIEDLIESLPESYEEKTPDVIECLNSALNIWDSKRFGLCLIISHKDFDDVENAFLALRASVTSGDAGNYASGLSALRERLRKLCIYEKFSMEGIL